MITGKRACSATPHPGNGRVAAHVGTDVLIISAGDGEVLESLGVGTTCLGGAGLVWGPGGGAVVGHSDHGRVVVSNVSDGYAAHSNWLGVEGVEWLNRTHALVLGHGDDGGRAYLVRVEPLTLEENITFSGRAWLVNGSVVVLDPNGTVWAWAPGEGIIWSTSTGSPRIMADMGEGMLFVLTQDTRIVAINVSDGSVEWEVKLPCNLPQTWYPNKLLGNFSASGDAVALDGIILGLNDSCIVGGIYREGRNILGGRVSFSSFVGWLSNDKALIRVGGSSAIIDVVDGTAKLLDGVYAYVANVPGGLIAVETRSGSYALILEDGAVTTLPDLGKGRIVGITPDRALIIRDRGADLLLIGIGNAVTKAATAGLGVVGAALAVLAAVLAFISRRAERGRINKRVLTESTDE